MQGIEIQHSATPDMCSVPWPVPQKTTAFSQCAFILDHRDRTIEPSVGRCGAGQSYTARILTNDPVDDSSINAVFWGRGALRQSLDFGVPYIALDARFKQGEKAIHCTYACSCMFLHVLHVLACSYSACSYFVPTGAPRSQTERYKSAIHLGSENIVMPGVKEDFIDLFRSGVDVRSDGASGKDVKIEGAKIYPNPSGLPFFESTKLINVFVKGNNGNTVCRNV